MHEDREDYFKSVLNSKITLIYLKIGTTQNSNKNPRNVLRHHKIEIYLLLVKQATCDKSDVAADDGDYIVKKQIYMMSSYILFVCTPYTHLEGLFLVFFVVSYFHISQSIRS